MATTTIVQHPQPHTVVMPAAQTVQYHHQSGPLPSANLNDVSAKVTGWIQVSCAVLSIILGGVAIAIEACNNSSVTAIWCGAVFYLPAGILGVIAGHQKQSCPIIGCMVMSILSTICSVSHFGVNLSGALNEGDPYGCYEDYYNYYYYLDYYKDEDYNGKLAVNIILTIIAVVEFVVSIYASAVMCGGTSCCRTRPNTTVTVVSNQAMPTTTTQVIQTGYPAQQMQYGQPAYPYQPPPGNYPAGNYPTGNYPPPAGNFPPPAGNYPSPAGNYPPPSYQQTEKI
ncbi:uncharacterized protein [Antedon mediterranea]|uniref:uncharacterized protein n=1 Tax=Antedon mediterranea TaxID=105859 RepID=UPI003AF69632